MQDGLMELMRKNGHISGSNAAYVEELYEEFLTDPLSISEQWRDFFKSLSAPEEEAYSDVSHSEIKKHFEALGKVSRHARVLSNEEIVNSEHESKQVEVLLLISSYRVRGHQKAKLDPLALMYRERVMDLELEFYNLSPIDHSTIFQTGPLFISRRKASLKTIIDILEEIYCSSIGYEFMHIVNLEEKQ
ncbi:MAG: 2-oxoglutarate dehydrogenase E1 component, partial [Pseudomonadota bacterium]|nr:2-oxoglutarate dehydrogenase E1 component [Pseudomonadota bacterium]